MRFCGVDLIEPDHLHGREDRFHDQPRPDMRKPVQTASAAIRDARRQGYQTQKHCEEPDKWIDEEIGPEPACPAIIHAGNGVRAEACGGLNCSLIATALYLVH